ncbi:MAG: hypothetical protein JW881_19230 [Spirochaetales bacterium]|nr:hypothetical protein [Spirochaetales bacterium]
MKFKTIFIIFNAIIILSFLFFFTMPFFIIGFDQFLHSLPKYWITLTLFLVTLGILNSYFIKNWKFFSYLENEDWYGLINYLETRIYQKDRISGYSIKILLNSYLCTSNIEGMKRLEYYIKGKKPSLIASYAVQFSIPYLISGNASESEAFFEKLLRLKNLKSRAWIMWNYGISQMQLNKLGQAKDTFAALISPSQDHIVFLLSMFMIKNLPGLDDSDKEKLESGKEAFLRLYTKNKWIKKLDKQKSNIQIMSLYRIIKEATDWIFPEKDKKEAEDGKQPDKSTEIPIPDETGTDIAQNATGNGEK